MAVSDITTEILTEKANHPELTPLNSESNTAIYMLWVFIVATIIDNFDSAMAQFKAAIQSIINNNQYGTNSWWYNKLLAFQYGDLLVFLNNTYQYATVDSTKQIIGFVSVTTVNGIVQFKVAANVNGQPAQLSTDQLNGVKSYCSQVQPSGIRFAVLSQPADLLKSYGNIYYDASGDITLIQPAVEAAINAYLLSLNSVNNTASITQNFNGTLYLNKFVDAVQAVTGIVGPQLDSLVLSAQNSGGNYVLVSSSYEPESGYFIIDPAYPLSETLTYIPFVG